MRESGCCVQSDITATNSSYGKVFNMTLLQIGWRNSDLVTNLPVNDVVINFSNFEKQAKQLEELSWGHTNWRFMMNFY